MDPLAEFSQRIAARLAEACKNATPVCEPAQYMAQFEPKFRQFQELANRLIAQVIQPRLEAVARFFPNTKVRRAAHENRCVGWFGYCERVPNSVKLDLSVDTDDRLEHVIVRCDLHIIPAFMKYEPHDKLVQPLDQFDVGKAATWVEERLLSFLDTYLSLDRGEDEMEVPLAKDPVCGMQVATPTALQTNHLGHTYYFCTEACRQRFTESPERFVVFETE